jgi:hypothetical protein
MMCVDLMSANTDLLRNFDQVRIEGHVKLWLPCSDTDQNYILQTSFLAIAFITLK